MHKNLYFVRHAQSHPSRRLLDAQWPLSERGLAQAAQLADLLAPLGIDQLFSSPYRRCMQTIGPFAETANLDIEERHDLHEREISKTLIEDFPLIWLQSWEDFDFALPGCESNRQAQGRFLEAVRSVIHESLGETIGICAHGAVIGLMLHEIEAGGGREYAEALTNPDVIRVIVSDDGWSWDRKVHLPGLLTIASLPDETPIDLD
jgi:2,3-bisphosphoglycerate-dependent phosphoglycerate mutase